MTLYRPPKHERNRHDHYATPPELAAALIIGLDRASIELPGPVFDPCAGAGRLLATLDDLGVSGFGSDRFPEAYPRRKWIHGDPIDATDVEAVAEVLGPCRSLLTNPPTKDDEGEFDEAMSKEDRAKAKKDKTKAVAKEQRALARRYNYKTIWQPEREELHARIAYACHTLLKANEIELFALLLPLPFEAAGGSRRLALMRSPFYRARIVCCWRPAWIDGTGGGGQMNHAWHVWARAGLAHAAVHVSREEAMGELGMDVSRPPLA